MRISRLIFALTACALILTWKPPLGVAAQQGRHFTYEETFGRGTDSPLDALPTISDWLDDQHYRQVTGSGEDREAVIVSAIDGSTRPDPDPPISHPRRFCRNH